MLYIHIPYCHRKCSYCAFFSLPGKHDRNRFVDALCAEIAARSNGSQLSTVYVGGGTPSLLTALQLANIVDAIKRGFDTSAVVEATIEANPENLMPRYLDQLADLAFFNRISIGIQSFDDAELKMLNRVHSSLQAFDAVVGAASAGFSNISVDLMMGLPGQTLDSWRHTLDRLDTLTAACGAVKHISCYELTVEPGTILEKQISMGRVAMPDDDLVASQYDALLGWCSAKGFEQYEVSNFAKCGFRSQHNSRYWNRTHYMGVGPAAHSFDGQRRRWNLSNLDAYIDGALNGAVPYEEECLSGFDAYNEYVMTALRTVEGIDKAAVPADCRDYLNEKIQPFVRNGLVSETQTHFRPSPDGLLHADGIAASLFVDYCDAGTPACGKHE